MNKKKTLTLTLIATILLMVGSFYLIFHDFMYRNVNFFEKYELRKEVTFAQKNINRETNHLYDKISQLLRLGKPTDYSDVEFLKGSSYLVALMDSNGKLTYGSMYENKTKNKTKLPNDVEDALKLNKIIPKQKGILVVNDKIFISASHATNDSGIILLAKELDPFLLESQHADKLSFKFEILKVRLPKEATTKNLIRELNNNKIAESVILSDIFGRPAVNLEVALERYMMMYSKSTLTYLIISLLLLSLLFSAVIVLLVRKMTRLEKEVQEASKLGALGALGANICHELNNPLTIVQGYTDNMIELMDEDKIKNTGLKNSLEKIKTQTERMMNTIKHIKEFTKFAEGKTPESVNLYQLITEVADEFKKQFELHEIEFSIKQEKSHPPIFINKTKLATAIQNLLSNARDAVDEKKQGNKKIEIIVTVEKEESDTYVVIEVVDNGIGISKTNMSKIFEPYFTTKDVAKGAGLGLSLVQSVVKEYNGKLNVESNKNKTSFTLKLPTNPLIDGKGK